MPIRQIETKYYLYNQNNANGRFELNDRYGIGHFVIIEARNYEEANNKLDEVTGGYSSGCECCGSRWVTFYSENDSDIYQDLEESFKYVELVSKSLKKDTIVCIHDYDEEITKKVIKYENNHQKN